MKVYFDANYWGHPADREPMREIWLDHAFRWDDLSGFIPAVYVSNEGIAVDFCVEIPNGAVASFFEKWQVLASGELTEEMREYALRENPLVFHFSAELSVDGKRLEHAGGCGAAYSRVIVGEEGIAQSLEEELVHAYGCDPDASWCFWREIYRWEREPENLHCLDLLLTAERKEYACDEIAVSLDSAGDVFELTRPRTGETYRLLVTEAWQEKIPVNALPHAEKLGERISWPEHYMAFSYDITPELSEKNFRLRAKGGGDKPRGSISSDGRHGVAAVSVIGGADGPTSVFIAGKTGGKKAERTAMSPLYSDPVTCAAWSPVFLEKERADLEIHINVC